MEFGHCGNESVLFFADLPEEDLEFNLYFNGSELQSEDVVEVFFNNQYVETLSESDISQKKIFRHTVPKEMIGKKGLLKVVLKFSNEDIETGVKCRCVYIDRKNKES